MAANGFGEHSPGGYSLSAVIITEVVLTFVFLLVILGSTDDRAPKGFAGLAIGLTLTVIHLISLPISNTSVNPARSTGVAFFNDDGAPAQLWVFWLAPLIGAAIAGIAYPYLFGKREQLAGRRSAMTGWKPATQASTDRRTHGPEVELPNLVDGHPRLQDHGHRRRLLLARRRNHGGGIQASNGWEAQWSWDFDRDATSPGRRGAWHCDRRHLGCAELSGEPGQRRSERRRRG